MAGASGVVSPDVTVVVIVYNDEARLPAAVGSVLAQTLRGVEAVVVDDCSTDGSFARAEEFAAREPHRVRALRLPRNSGGCGAPRNRGVEAARGRYVMFLDSDDVLEPNACRNMLEAAERTGADLVSGLCVRVRVDSRHRSADPWYPWLYRTTRTLESIAELPDLLVYDTLSTNKCYRRAFLTGQRLTFPVGVHYEDLLFSARAYTAARRITLIPNRVYEWRVASGGGRRSISNRRDEIGNFAQRMEIHRRVDRLLAERGLDELKFAKDVKFLKHDLVLHLRDLPLLDEEYRQAFAELAGGYLATLDPAALREVDPVHAICAYLLARRDWAELLPAADTLANRGKLSAPLVERDDRVYWCGGHLADPLGREVLDVTQLGYHTAPLGELFLRNELTGYRADADGTVFLAGSVVNPLGRIGPGTPLRGRLELRARRHSPQTFRVPLTTLRRTDRALHWTACVDLPKVLRPLGVFDTVWDVRVELAVGDGEGERLRTRISGGGTALEGAASLPVRPRLTRLAADRVAPELSRRGHLAFHLLAEGRAASRTQGWVRAALATGALGRVKDALRRARRLARSGETRIRLYHRVFCRLPHRRGLVVFESHLGRQYSDSPRALYEEMRRRGLRFEAVWSYAGGRPEGFPSDAVLVRRWSLRYLRALARAEFWIDNQGFPLKLAKRPGTTYIQTWHGSALKRMGFDEPGLRAMPATARAAHRAALDRFDCFLVRSEHDVRTLVRAFGLPEGVPLRSGYPRNDALVAARLREEETGVRRRGPLAERLGITPDRQILLYAPTFRGAGGGPTPLELPFDVEEFTRRFGDRFVLLVRAHYLDRVVLPPSVRGTVLDVGAEHDITPLLTLADGLITDYSSVMFDYALLDRPMLFYAHDWDEYAGQGRGTYFDLRSEAPGPVLADQAELFTAIGELKAADSQFTEARRQFRERYGELDRGDAAARVVDVYFGAGDRS
ncbi:CDP-glycerol glycerophosphotransferase family protein [Streptomyces sp. NPDC058045]|uniref:bifunctional glycosyltransferase/CDP-glycerol:glycerophosphate glycerophosphotransferase n=1 Tax=Streptomyces sp. NPDC058045 TaxID=3346311 RepID=UPI0036EBA7E3